jgi:8-amino-7-oxononanoate synthase
MSGFLEDLGRQAAAREQAGLTRRLDVRPERADDDALDLAGNDYLGLARHPVVIEAAGAAARRYGAGARASRLVTGTLPVHAELEAALAEFIGFPAALVLSTGYQANLAVVSALADAEALVVSDAHIHASLIDGARLSRATVAVNRHNDVGHVAELLRTRSQDRAVVLVESVYSVDGDAAPLAELADVTRAEGAVLVVDEAHAVGVTGPLGRGGCAAAAIAGADHVVVTLTLSKSLGAQGGAVLAHAAVREHLVNTARPFVFDTGLAPPSAGAAGAALALLAGDPQLPRRVRSHAATLADACGVPVPAGAVLSVPMAGPREALAAVATCAEHGIRVGCFRPPSTPDGTSRLRVTAHADHRDEDVGRAAAVLKAVTT